MDRLVSGMIVTLWMSSAALAQAPTAPPAQSMFPADARIGYVNLQVVLAKSKLGQQGSAKLKQLTDERDAALAAATKEIADLQARLNAQRGTLTAEAGNALVKELNFKQAQLNFDRETWQLKAQQASEDMLADFRAQLLPVVESIREEHNLLLVFSLPTPGVLAIDPRLDLSAELVQRLDARTK